MRFRHIATPHFGISGHFNALVTQLVLPLHLDTETLRPQNFPSISGRRTAIEPVIFPSICKHPSPEVSVRVISCLGS